MPDADQQKAVDELRAKMDAEHPIDLDAKRDEVVVTKSSSQETIENANTRNEELLRTITDRAMVELTSLQETIASLKAAIVESHDHTVQSFQEHASLAVDVIAAKVVIADQVETIRKRFQGRLVTVPR